MTIQEDIKNIIEVMKRGGVILYPTDTMWGIGCDATNAEVVVEAYKIKKQDGLKTLICPVDSGMRLQRYVGQVPNVIWDLLDMAVKPTTIILDGATNPAPNLIAENGSTVLRIIREPFSHELYCRFRKALVSTGVNVSGEPAAANYCDISQEMLGTIDYVCHSRKQEHKLHTPGSIIKLVKGGEVTIIRR